MKQVIYNYKTGELQIIEVPSPALKAGFVLVKNINSLVSVGTEKYMLEMAKKSLIGKAKARPDLVKQVIAKIKAEGIIEAYKATTARLDSPIPLGYSCAGVVLDVGEGVEEFNKGSRVACAGSGYASHAEVVCVPKNLCVRIPENVDFESASFVALGGIALQAVRMARPSLGYKVVVIGLGLLGQITIQLLKSSGCHVFGIDISEEKVKMAIENGCESGAISGEADVLSATRQYAPQGFDSVIIMAATKSSEPLDLATEIARERARIVAAGLIKLEIPRKTFFEKELELVVSRAWGPGVLDDIYLEKNIDYPYSYVRWTAKRNLEEFLSQVSKNSVKVSHLITHRFLIEKAIEAYELVLKAEEPYIGVLINYSSDIEKIEASKKFMTQPVLKTQKHRAFDKSDGPISIGFIGAGLFATGTILPILRSMKNIKLKGVVSATGIKAQHAAQKFGFEYFSTDYQELLKDDDIDLVFVMTRHGSHAYLVTEALKSGKHVFVEKPLCINEKQIKEILATCNEISIPNKILMVGFNRRFSPLASWLKEKFKRVQEPLSLHCTVNAGYITPEHWIFDQEDGGGRIIGEVCHFIDLIQFFTDSLPERVHAEYIESGSYKMSDNVSISLKMKNGSIGSILYVASGDKRFPRERVEIFGGGTVGVIDNFKEAIFICNGKKKKKKNWLRIDRGHKKEMEVLFSSIKEAKNPVAIEEYISTSLATLALEKSLREGTPLKLEPESCVKT